ncbi:MAG: two-component regulator propeller domain-containing protein, partial [Melioribacteraceae bacterium]|nr:two-component regulator propeller domain-containing protein [Melioribacteraceae bacterium]
IGTDIGVIRYNITTETVKQFSNDPSDSKSLLDNRISALYEDQQGQILIGTFKSGLHIYNPKNELLNRISFDAKNPGKIHAPYSEESVFGTDPHVNIIHQDQKGNYWIGTTGKGINYFDTRKRTFKNYHFDLVNPQILWSIYEDGQGSLWIGGGLGCGLFRTDLFARQYNLDTNFINVEAAYESPLNPGILWINSRQNSLSKLNLITNKITKYVHDKNNKKSIGHNWVRSAYQENDTILWLGLGTGGAEGGGSGDGGIDRMNIETGEFKHFKLTRDDDGLDDFSYTVFTMCEDEEGYLWLGAGKGGLFRSDKDKKEFKHLSLLKNDNTFKDVALNIVRIDFNGDIWVVDSKDQGIVYLYNREKESFTPFLKGFRVTNVILDKQKWLVLSTWDNGLVHLNPSDGSYKHYTKKDGLPSNNALDIYEGGGDIIWVGTRMGPAKFNAATGKISSLSLPKDRYNWGIFRASDDKVYLGVRDGLLSFHPDQVLGNHYPPKVLLERLNITGNSVNLLNKRR